MKKAKKLRSYSDYTLGAWQEICGIDKTKTPLSLPKQVVKPSDWLLKTLELNQAWLPINSEKARSELLTTPILVEWLRSNANVFLQNFQSAIGEILIGNSYFLSVSNLK